MASVNSPIRNLVKPFLFKLLGKRGYKYAQYFGKMRDIELQLVEEKEMRLLPFFIKDGDATIDIGANYAYYTHRLSKIVGPAGKVFAFEPIPFTYSVCDMIVKKSKLKNVELFNLGISEKSQTLTFSVPKLAYGPISAGQAHIAGRSNNAVDKEKYYNFNEEEDILCNVVALDNFELAIGDRPLTFIKIDIEGAEYFALMGMEKLILRYKPIMLIEVQPYFLQGFNIDESDFKNYIVNTLGYDIYYYNGDANKLQPVKGTFHDDNFMLIPTGTAGIFKSIIGND